MKIARVALDVPLPRLFDYVATDVGNDDVGCRVVIPFGRRTVIGVVVELAAASTLPANRLRPITALLRDTPRLHPSDLRLLSFASAYYQYPMGQVVLGALPQRLKVPRASSREKCDLALTAAGAALQEASLPARARTRRRMLALLREQGSLSSQTLKSLSRTEREVIADFRRLGLVEAKPKGASIISSSVDTSGPGRTLTPDQTVALARIVSELGRYGALLLCGVTGSGKTEVYLGAAAEALSRGSQVLLLVPEIALTPQLQSMVAQRFPDQKIAALHSGLNETEREHNWIAAQSGEARIVLGTRLAVFTPLPALGLIIVDEEHDASFKQTEGFCYSARDLAVVRARQLGIPVVLGSATPSLETYYNAKTGRYSFLRLPTRVNARPPSIASIPMRGVHTLEGLAPQLIEAISQRLARREQTLVFINRRGFAPVLMCHSCGWLSGCHRCSSQLVLHMPARELHCHHCGHRARVPSACPKCGNPALSPIGQGTQRIEAALVERFPSARILRIDRDSTRAKHAWTDMRRRIQEREVDILVGTQLLAKGHDFPHLALVGVLNADAMLYSSDFRASERLYALLTQVAGRAGRGDAPGEVLIQTEFPEHPLYTALRAQDLERFADQLLEERKRAGFPPYVHQALLRAEASKIDSAMRFLDHAKEIGRALGGVDLYDPVPATMVRLAGRERAQLLVQAQTRPALHGFLAAWRDLLASQDSRTARWMLEVDPLEL